MTKEELITRLVDLTDTVEEDERQDFDDGEIEDLIVEAGIPITRSNQISVGEYLKQYRRGG